MKRIIKPILFVAIAFSFTVPAAIADTDPQVIVLTQTPCQFIETERELLKDPPRSYNGCKKFNKKTAATRPIIPLKLKSGKYIFRVKNKNVPYDLGFWLRGKGFSRAILPSVSGGGIKLGKSKDYKITLKKGEYVYSCPLNPTPDYPLVVE
ncbi:MAG: hypothetical protein ACE5EN_05215 [Nitrospinota bacterium]